MAFDQISKAVAHVVSKAPSRSCSAATTRSATRPSAAWRSICDGNLGIIHFDRHVDTQETDLDERMHTTPWFHATDIPNVPAKNLVQIGIGGWQAPRPGVKVGRERGTTIMTVTDCVEMGIEEAAERALEVAWDGADAVWLSLRRGLPRRGIRARHRLAGAGRLPAARGAQVHPAHRRAPLAGIEVVECSPPYDNAEITALIEHARDLRHARLPGARR